MAFVTLDGSGNVNGVFSRAQNPPQPAGYAVIADDDARLAAFAASQVSKPRPPTPREWIERLSPTTQAAITRAAATDSSGALLLWLLKAAGNPAIDVTSTETQQGVAALVSLSVITADDAATLLAS